MAHFSGQAGNALRTCVATEGSLGGPLRWAELFGSISTSTQATASEDAWRARKKPKCWLENFTMPARPKSRRTWRRHIDGSHATTRRLTWSHPTGANYWW